MNTLFLLMAEFETSDIPLEIVAKKYLNLERAEAIRKARNHSLPFPTYKAGSNKSGYLVNVKDLAEHLDSQRAKAKDTWQAFNAT